MSTQVSPAELRVWAKDNGFEIGDRGRIPAEIHDAYAASKRRQGAVVHQPPPVAAAPSGPEVQQLQDSLEQAVGRLGNLEVLVRELVTRLEVLERPANREQPRRWSRKGSK